MNVEDFTKYQVRNDIRSMQTQYLTYEISRRNLVLTDPPEGPGIRADHRAPGRGRLGDPGGQAAVQTTNLINFQSRLLDARKQAGDELAAVPARSD